MGAGPSCPLKNVADHAGQGGPSCEIKPPVGRAASWRSGPYSKNVAIKYLERSFLTEPVSCGTTHPQDKEGHRASSPATE